MYTWFAGFRAFGHSDQPLSFSGTYFHKSSLYGSLSFFFPFMIESTMVCRAYMKFLSREKYEFLLFECLSIYNWHLDCWQSKKGQLSCLLFCWCCFFCVKDNICNIWERLVFTYQKSSLILRTPCTSTCLFSSFLWLSNDLKRETIEEIKKSNS